MSGEDLYTLLKHLLKLTTDGPPTDGPPTDTSTTTDAPTPQPSEPVVAPPTPRPLIRHQSVESGTNHLRDAVESNLVDHVRNIIRAGDEDSFLGKRSEYIVT